MVFKSDFNIIKASLITTIFVVAGWLGFQGVLELLDITGLNPLIKIGISVFIFWLGYKLGMKRYHPSRV